MPILIWKNRGGFSFKNTDGFVWRTRFVFDELMAAAGLDDGFAYERFVYDALDEAAGLGDSFGAAGSIYEQSQIEAAAMSDAMTTQWTGYASITCGMVADDCLFWGARGYFRTGFIGRGPGVGFSGKGPRADFAGRGPGVGFNGKGPRADFAGRGPGVDFDFVEDC